MALEHLARALVVQNSPLEGAGLLGRLLEDDGFDVHTIDARHAKFPSDTFDVLVILGGPASANDDLEYIRQEQSLLRTHMQRSTPIIGICLGSQLIAKSCGARVYKGTHTEFGFYSDMVRDKSDGMFAGMPEMFDVFHWHAETFDLPDDAQRLARSRSYENQAFRVGSAVGLQFHLEIGRGMLESWIGAAKREMADTAKDADSIRADAESLIPAVNSNLRIFYANFKKEFGL